MNPPDNAKPKDLLPGQDIELEDEPKTEQNLLLPAAEASANTTRSQSKPEPEPKRKSRAKVKKDGKFGYVDLLGRFAIAPQFDDANDFSEGFAAVRANGTWGYVDKTGKILAQGFARASDFSNGTATVQPKEKWSFVQANSREIKVDDRTTGRISAGSNCALVNPQWAQALRSEVQSPRAPSTQRAIWRRALPSSGVPSLEGQDKELLARNLHDSQQQQEFTEIGHRLSYPEGSS